MYIYAYVCMSMFCIEEATEMAAKYMQNKKLCF